MKKLKYVGKINIFIPELGVGLPSGDNIISVTDKQAAGLLKFESGSKKQFEILQEKKEIPVPKNDYDGGLK